MIFLKTFNCGWHNGTRPLLSVQPSRGLVDEKFQIVVTNLPLKQEAFGQYISDEHGTVTVAKDESLGGTYKGTDPMGLLWSMRPIPGSQQGVRLRKRDVLTPMVVHISVYIGHLCQGFSHKTPLATSVAERWYIAPGVKRVNVSEKEVRGTLFIPPGPGPYPGVLDLWGASAGLIEYRAALLASHGFVSMTLEYFPPKGLRLKDVHASYVEKAYQILKNHPMVQKDCLGMLGLCFGSAMTLRMVAYSKVIKPQCCVCISGSHLIPVNKSLFEVFDEMKKEQIRVNEDNQEIHRDVIVAVSSDPDLKVDVGRIKCPLLLVNGDDDQTFPAVESAEDMAMMMEKAGNRHLMEVLTYHGAGHLIEPPYLPTIHSTNYYLIWKKKRVVMLWGGQTKLHAYAQEDAWKKILKFLWQHLYISSALH
uniref:Acyl-CoA thioesterase 16 n=1 Tax=Sinocyclocheilus rhinocerous TaxID=307959 RepID=A0A673N657_9TELE